MGRGPRNQSRPIGPDTVGPRAGRASGPRPTLGGAPGPRPRLRRPPRGADALGGGGRALPPSRPAARAASGGDLAAAEPRLRPQPRRVRWRTARSRPSRRRQKAGTNQPSTGAVMCHPASVRRAALRAGRRRRRSTAPCLLRFDCRTSVAPRRRILNGCPSLRRRAHGGGRCTRWRRRSAAAASRLTCRCLRPASWRVGVVQK